MTSGQQTKIIHHYKKKTKEKLLERNGRIKVQSKPRYGKKDETERERKRKKERKKGKRKEGSFSELSSIQLIFYLQTLCVQMQMTENTK
jgi:hypothetical protein